MLQSLEVFGFKSFADRTTFAFAPGITCVVGPNGSGKSNVVDAMKWLLGDQSPKNLRGKQMSDVIFNGSRTRKASGLAEATLSFDNRQGILSTPLQDVRITRRLYQGGDSEYLINGEICRLKDIRELFVGTGAATSAYSIIEQGRVGQVLQGNASTRRVLFDEAAGISKFKSRRDDATTKLERVSQNLLRLTDIVDEVESQLNACRSRAGKAAKYRELAVQYDAVRLGLAADDVRLLSRQRQGLRERQQLASSQLHETQQKLSAVETERDSLRDRFRDADEELQRREAKLSTLMQQRSSLETSLKHLDDRSREIESDIQVLRRQRHDLKLRVHDIEEEISREEADWKLAEQQVQTIDAQRNRLEAARTAQQDQLELLRLERQRLQSQLGELQRQQAACESHLKHLHVREETTRNAIAERQLEQEQTSQLLQEKEAEVARYSARYEAVLQEHRQLRQEQDASIRQRDQIVDQLNTMTVRQAADREQRSAWEARLGLLKDMEERQLGLSIGVQEILDRSRRSPLPPWKHVLGVVVDFFECDLEYAPLIEIALGHDAQAIVVDRISPIAEYLDRQSIPFEGRLSFLELPQNGTRESASADPRLIEFAAQLKETEGIVGRADQFLRCESLHRPL
ncbi:MAG: AAA family ATPase, partial [Planctomycetaceae bacterium]|nr:AAA family ATPase [Planctomycetaceae bacterium]